MEQTPFTRKRKYLYYTGMGIIVLGVIGIAFIIISRTYLHEPWATIASIVLVCGALLAGLAKPTERPRPTGYLDQSVRALPIALAICAAIALPFGAWNLFQGYTSERWPQIRGFISSAKIARHYGRHGSTYTAEITYRYEVAGAAYTAARLSFPEHSFDSPAPVQAVLDRYPIGKTISVFYRPNDPQQAVLEPGITGDTWFAPTVGIIALASSLILPRIKRRRY